MMVTVHTINNLTPSQLKRLGEIWLAGNQQAHHFIPSEYWEKNQAALLAALPDAEVTVTVDDQGRILGFAGMQGNELAGLFVDQASRQHGVGTALIRYLQQHHRRITLHVYVKNQPAYQFYAQQQFTTIARQVDDATGEAELTMQWVG